jgi:hypothetical protein
LILTGRVSFPALILKLSIKQNRIRTVINNNSDLNSFKFWKIHTKKKQKKHVTFLAICKCSSFSSIYSLYSEKEHRKF